MKKRHGVKKEQGEKERAVLCVCACARVQPCVHTASPAQRPRGEAVMEPREGEAMLMVQVLGRR